MTAAERILKVTQNRLAGFKSIEDINSYMASDLMIAKVRETIEQLLALGDSVKADDLQGRLKSTQQEAVRQLPGIKNATVFGQSMHLLVDQSMPEQRIHDRLAEVGISQADIRPIAASLEDVFVTLTAKHSNGNGK